MTASHGVCAGSDVAYAGAECFCVNTEKAWRHPVEMAPNVYRAEGAPWRRNLMELEK